VTLQKSAGSKLPRGVKPLIRTTQPYAKKIAHRGNPGFIEPALATSIEKHGSRSQRDVDQTLSSDCAR
jgi:hypothetical protein